MKILFVIQGLRSGGAERVMSLLCNSLSQRGHEVVLAITETMEDFAYEISPMVEIVDVTTKTGSVKKNRIKQIKNLRRLYKKRKPDVVVSFITRTNICAVLAGIGLRTPVILSERNNPAVDPASHSTRKLRDIVYPLADGYVFQTRFAKECFPEKIQNKSVVIFNPVSDTVTGVLPSVRQKRIIAVGRLEDQKNIPMMIRALARVLPQYQEYYADIFGTGSLEGLLQTKIDEIDLQNRIHLRGFTSKAIQEMADSEIYVMTSNFEGMPNALMEAMCVGCACISTDAPAYGARELIVDGENGFLIPVNDEEALVEKLNTLLSERTMVENFGKKAKEVYINFNTEAIVNQWLAYIERVRGVKHE